jgi:hypothetical protein
VLLHMVAPALFVDESTHGRARTECRSLRNEMQDSAIIVLGNLNNPQTLAFASIGGQPSRIKNLSTAGGVERSAIQNQRRTRIYRRHLDKICFKLVKKRIVVIEAFAHRGMLGPSSGRHAPVIESSDGLPDLVWSDDSTNLS